MLESSVDKVELLKVFAEIMWRNLQERFAYHLGNGCWCQSYNGRPKYAKNIRWPEAKESTLERQAENPTIAACARPVKTHGYGWVNGLS